MNQEENNPQENKKDQPMAENANQPNMVKEPEAPVNEADNKKPKKKFSKPGIIVITILILVFLIVGTMPIVSNIQQHKTPAPTSYYKPEESLAEDVYNGQDDNSEKADKKETEKDSNNIEQELVINISPYYGKSRFDLSKCLFGCAEDYKSAAPQGGSIWLRRTGDGKSSISLKGYGYLAGEYDIEFNDEIIDAYLAGFGNGGSQAILFLKKDGTVDYIFPYLQDNKNGLQKYSLDNVDDIAYFMQADGLEGEYYNLTILAFRSDGYFYDLGGYLNSQNDILYSQNELTTSD